MSSLWQKITLSDLSLPQWQRHSYLTRWIGWLGPWRSQSWLLSSGEAIGAILAVAVLGSVPFVNNSFLGFLLAICALFWFLLTLTDDHPRGSTPIHLTLLVFWGIATIASAFAPERALGLQGLKRIAFSDGISKLTLYLLFFALLARLLRSVRLRQWILAAYLQVALVVSVYGVRQLIVGAKPLATWVDPDSPLSKTTRAYSFLGNPNVLAAYLLPAIALSLAAIWVWQRPLPKVMAGVMVAIHLWCMYGTQSRGGWIAMVGMLGAMAVGVYYWYRPSMGQFWQRWLLPLGLGGTVLTISLLVAALPPLRERVLSIFVGRGDSSNSFRFNVWQAVSQMVQQHFVLGIGYGDRVFKKVYPIYQINPKYSALSAYSIYLETLVEMGIVGLITLVWSIGVTWFHGCLPLKSLRSQSELQYFWLLAGLGGSIGLGIQGFFDTVWYRPDINTLWWLMLGLIASFYAPITTEPAPSTKTNHGAWAKGPTPP